MTATLLSYVLSVEYSTNLRERPVVYISPKVPEKSVTEFSVGEKGEKEERLFWWLVGNFTCTFRWRFSYKCFNPG